VTTEEAIARLHTDPDFICIRRFDYSVETLLERFPDGAPDKTIAQALMISIEDVESLYNGIVAKLRAQLDPSL
jgi:hypothetical protein